MYAKHLKDYVICEDENVYKAHWKLYRNESILVVLDSDEKYKGLITFKDMKKSYDNPMIDIREICNIKGKMDISALEERLEKAVLVIGDIRKTTADFLTKFSSAPIGCMLIDVDYYSSTVSILQLLENDDTNFLPRIYMYFDDIHPEYEFSGENLAIKEFNMNHDEIKISPEGLSYPDYRLKTKICHRFVHEKYNELVNTAFGNQFTPDDYELKLKGFL